MDNKGSKGSQKNLNTKQLSNVQGKRRQSATRLWDGKDRNSNRLLRSITPPSGRDQPAKRPAVDVPALRWTHPVGHSVRVRK